MFYIDNMGETVFDGIVIGLAGYLLLGLATGRPVSSWRPANLAGLAVAAALGVALAWWVLPRPWLAPARHLALGGMALWVGVRMAFPRHDNELAHGLRPFGWMTIAIGVLEIVIAIIET